MAFLPRIKQRLDIADFILLRVSREVYAKRRAKCCDRKLSDVTQSRASAIWPIALLFGKTPWVEVATHCLQMTNRSGRGITSRTAALLALPMVDLDQKEFRLMP
jgi:hypothetical protein